MAGKYQHYLQKMLQKGFRTSCSGKRPSVFVYTKDSETVRKRAEDFGGEDEFYSTVSDGRSGTLDDRITQWEAKRQADVRRWRNMPDGTYVSSQEAAEFVGLTGVRTRAIRDTFRRIFEDLFPRFTSVLQDPDILMSHLDKNIDLNEVYDAALAQYEGFSPDEIAQTYVVPEHRAARRMLDYAMSEILGHRLSKVLRELDREINEAIEDDAFNASKLHAEAMGKLLDQGLARADLLALNWALRSNEQDLPWILPDCAVITVKKDGQFCPFLFGNSDDTVGMLLPLSPKLMLVGSVEDPASISLTGYTASAVACSREWFIAHEYRNDLDALRPTISSRSDAEISEGMDAALSKIDPLRTNKEVSAIQPVQEWSVTGHNIDIDEEGLLNLAQPLCDIISEASYHYDLSRLNKVVICSDVPAAMAACDKCELVIYDDQDTRRVMNWVECGDGELSYALCIHIMAVKAICDPVHISYQATLRHLMQILAHVHNRSVIASVQPDLRKMLDAFTDDDLGPWARDVVMYAALTFMDTITAARIEEIDEFITKSVTSRFFEALTIFQDSPLPDRGNQEENNAIAEQLSHAASEVMISACKYLALSHSEAFDPMQGAVGNDRIDLKIKALGIEGWLSRLDFDLQRLRISFSAPLDPERIVVLQRHFERLFWAKSTLLFRHEGGEGWVTPFPDNCQNYQSISEYLRVGITDLIPENLAEQARLALGFE